MINFIKRNFLNRQFVIFTIIGGINTFNGSLFAFIYSLFMQANLAFVAGYMSALSIAYVLNSIFTFNERLSFTKLIKFAISYIPNFIIQYIVVFIIYNILGLLPIIAYITAAIIGVPITFLFLKLFAFKKQGGITNESHNSSRGDG